MEENKEKTSDEVERILEELESADLVYNPFSAVPKEQLLKALDFLEEHAEDK